MTKKLIFALAAMTLPTSSIAASLSDAVRADMPSLMALYRDLHANPELSMQEARTPAKLAPELRKLGFTVTQRVGKAGVVAVMKNGPGPVLLLRADMDGLPVVEQTGLPFASKVKATRAAGGGSGGAGGGRRGARPRAARAGLGAPAQPALPFASKVRATSVAGVESGVMHACGHDTHMTAWVGAARRLVQMKDRWSGTLVM